MIKTPEQHERARKVIRWLKEKGYQPYDQVPEEEYLRHWDNCFELLEILDKE
ncbi:tail-completion protein [Vibrio phage 1.170.O._10N.261.52.C3]|nr:tail-completion protein [Vibrio phage 1.170.O._10N.261.52.C3]